MSSKTNIFTIQRAALPILIALGALVGGFFINPVIVWTVVLLGMLGAILLGRAGSIIFCFWLWGAVAPLAMKYSGSPIVGYLDEILMVLVGVTLFGESVLNNKKVPSADTFIRLFMGLALSILVSFLVNPKSLTNAFQALFTYYLFPVILISTLIQVKITSKSCAFFIKCLMGLFFVHLMLNIGWFLRINPLRNVFMYSTVDFAQGTFGGAERSAYFTIAVLFVCLAATLKARARKAILWMVGGMLALVNLFLTHTNHAYLMLVALYGLFIFLFPQKRAVKIGLAVCGLGLALTFPVLERTFSTAGFLEYQENVAEQLSAKTLSLRYEQFRISPKIRLLNRIVVQNARYSPTEWLVGMGPGMGVSVVGMNRISPKALEYLAEYYMTQSGTQEMSDGSIMTSAYSGIFSIWSELGIVGFILYLSLYIYPWIRVRRQWKSGMYGDSSQLLLAESFLMVIPLYLMCNVLFDNFWGDFFVIGIWVWAAFVWNPIKTPDEEPVKAGVLDQNE